MAVLRDVVSLYVCFVRIWLGFPSACPKATGQGFRYLLLDIQGVLRTGVQACGS